MLDAVAASNGLIGAVGARFTACHRRRDLVALHVLDDAFAHPEPGTAAAGDVLPPAGGVATWR